MIALAAPTIFLYGPPATGKSTCARNLAKALNKAMFDLDTVIEQTLGMTIPQYVEKAGPEAFRDAETKALEVLCKKAPEAVIALGGGALLRDQNRAMVEACGPILCIQTPFEVLAKRVERKAGSRPWTKNANQLKQTLESRQAHYNSFPLQLRLDQEFPPQEVCERAMTCLGRFTVSGMGDPYTVFIAPHAVDTLAKTLAQLNPPPKHLLLVGDSNTLPLYGERVLKAVGGLPCQTFEIPAGEASKSVTTILQLWAAMGAAHLERNDMAIALGGGVTGDLTGFAAATWLRGIRWLNMPTSLLSMVDAGIGGKTGADLPSGKNLVGAFHPPCAVISDTTFLKTLPAREMRCGLAETYKHAVIADAPLAQMTTALQQHADDIDYLTQLVSRSAAVKIHTIVKDPFEKIGLRAALNLGHTIGHAVEAASQFTLAHGEAVAIGLVAVARIAEKMTLAPAGFADQCIVDFQRIGLPTEIPLELSRDQILKFLSNDKKKTDGHVRFVLPEALGKVSTGCLVPQEVLNAILK